MTSLVTLWRTATTTSSWLVVVVVVVGWWPRGCQGHGRLMDPPARNSMWRLGFPNPVNYNDNELYCGGRVTQWARNKGRCGVCGDPYHLDRPHETGGKYANRIITRDYQQGDVINVVIHITANHQGFFEFRICPVEDPAREVTHECLESNVLQLAPNQGRHGYRYSLDNGKSNQFFNYSVILPPGLTCERCVLQWKYKTGNTWDKDPDGTYCVGCGPQEEFYNCADVSITSRDSSLGKPFSKLDQKNVNTYRGRFHSTTNAIGENIDSPYIKNGRYKHLTSGTKIENTKQIGIRNENKMDENIAKFLPKRIHKSPFLPQTKLFKDMNTKLDFIKPRYKNNDDDRDDVKAKNWALLDKDFRYKDIKDITAVPYSLVWDSLGKKLFLFSREKQVKNELVRNSDKDDRNQNIFDTKRVTPKSFEHESKKNTYFDDVINIENRGRNELLHQLKLAKLQQLEWLSNYQQLPNTPLDKTSVSNGQRLDFTPSDRDILSDYVNFNKAVSNISKTEDSPQKLDGELFIPSYAQENIIPEKYAPSSEKSHFVFIKPPKDIVKQPMKEDADKLSSITLISKTIKNKKSNLHKKMQHWLLKALRVRNSQQENSELINKHKDEQEQILNQRAIQENNLLDAKNPNPNPDQVTIQPLQVDTNSLYQEDEYPPTIFETQNKQPKQVSDDLNSISTKPHQSPKTQEGLIGAIVKLLVQAKVLDLNKFNLKPPRNTNPKNDERTLTDLATTKFNDKTKLHQTIDQKATPLDSKHLNSDSMIYVYDKNGNSENKLYQKTKARLRPSVPIAYQNQIQLRGSKSQTDPPIFFDDLDLGSKRVGIQTYGGHILGNDVITSPRDRTRDRQNNIGNQMRMKSASRKYHVTSSPSPQNNNFKSFIRGPYNLPPRQNVNRNIENYIYNNNDDNVIYGDSKNSNNKMYGVSNTQRFQSSQYRRRNEFNDNTWPHEKRVKSNPRFVPYKNSNPGATMIQSNPKPIVMRRNNQQFNQLNVQTFNIQKPRKLVCKSLIELGGGMDQWCIDNCNANFCPQSICICKTEQRKYRQLPAATSYSRGLPLDETQSRPISYRPVSNNNSNKNVGVHTKHRRLNTGHHSYFHKRSILQNYENPQSQLLDYQYPQTYITDTVYAPVPTEQRPFNQIMYHDPYNIYRHKTQINTNNKNGNIVLASQNIHTPDKTLSYNFVKEQSPKRTKPKRFEIEESLSSTPFQNDASRKPSDKYSNNNGADNIRAIPPITLYSSLSRRRRKLRKRTSSQNKSQNNSNPPNQVTVQPYPSYTLTNENGEPFVLWFANKNPEPSNNDIISLANSNTMAAFNHDKHADAARNRNTIKVPNKSIKSVPKVKTNPSPPQLSSSSPSLQYDNLDRNGSPNIQGSKKALVRAKLLSCKAIGAYEGLGHFDQWCDSTCRSTMCPLMICRCE